MSHSWSVAVGYISAKIHVQRYINQVLYELSLSLLVKTLDLELRETRFLPACCGVLPETTKQMRSALSVFRREVLSAPAAGNSFWMVLLTFVYKPLIGKIDMDSQDSCLLTYLLTQLIFVHSKYGMKLSVNIKWSLLFFSSSSSFGP